MRYVFEDCELDSQCCEFRRAGVPLALGPKNFDMLLYLIRHRHRVVPKQELVEHVWPGQFIGDASLARCISTLRQAIHPHGSARGIIKTFYGRGYRFSAPVKEHGPTSFADTRRQVTVLRAELADSHRLMEDMSAEDFEVLLSNLFTRVTRIVWQYDGCIRHFTESGFLALFGLHPLRNHALAAARAAVALRHRPPTGSSPDLQVLSVHLKCGLHSGDVVGRHIHDEPLLTYMALGNTFHLADYLQRFAVPDQIIVSETTARLLDGVAELKKCLNAELPAPARTAYTLDHLHPASHPHVFLPPGRDGRFLRPSGINNALL